MTRKTSLGARGDSVCESMGLRMHIIIRGFPGGSVVKNPPANAEKMERYTYLNAEFRRIARRDKKAFLSDQCKEIEREKKKKRNRGKQ